MRGRDAGPPPTVSPSPPVGVAIPTGGGSRHEEERAAVPANRSSSIMVVFLVGHPPERLGPPLAQLAQVRLQPFAGPVRTAASLVREPALFAENLCLGVVKVD